MIHLKPFNESSASTPKVQLLTTIELDDIVKQVDDEVDSLYSGVITSFKTYLKNKGLVDDGIEDKKLWKNIAGGFTKAKPSLKKSKESIKRWVLSKVDKDQSRMRSDIIDIETFLSLDTEIDSIKEGDEVIALTSHSTDRVKNFPAIISFKVEHIKLTNNFGWLGLASNDSYCPQINGPWGMINIKCHKLIVTKETYNSFVSADKRI